MKLFKGIVEEMYGLTVIIKGIIDYLIYSYDQ